VTCSVLGLIFGVGFKIWQHKKEQKEKKLTEMQRADAQLGVQYEQDPYVPKK
jgi:hypothetical protein